MLNQVTIMGRVVTAPTTRKAGKNHVVCDFSVAVDRDYKDADGNYPTDFFRVTAWDGTAEFIANYFAEIGTPMIITGRLILNQWETDEGEKRQSVLIQAEHVYFAERKAKEEKAEKSQRKTYGKR